MAQIQTLTFTNKTGFCSSKKRVILTFLTMTLFLSIIGICAYQIAYGQSGSTWTPPQELGQLGHRLPINLKPFHYKLKLIPYLSAAEQFRIDGYAAISFTCIKSTNLIVLNLKNITLNGVKVQEVEGEEDNSNVTRQLDVISQEFDPSRDLYTAKVNERLEEGTSYRIVLQYQGTLNDQLVGFYRSSYVDKNTNETRWMGVTQFSPTDARRAFPAFDEPAFKAKFQISIGRQQHMKTLSNMEIVSNETMNGYMNDWIWDHYDTTLKMSTYLVGFAVMDFENRLSIQVSNSTKFQVWAREDAIGQTDYAGEIGPKILKHFEEYFGIDFPLPKVDMIAVPEHRFNAMENWGLITYRELVILFDSNYSSDANKQRIAEVVSHELGHQWFGNLVTPAWWSDLWLKEGFASYLAYIGVNFVEPEWEILDLFVVSEIQNVFRLDALNNSHPIYIPVGHPDEINRIFDDISYSKGCSIIRMMDHFLTSATFKQGITNYLNKWNFSNADQSDLWDCLTEQGHNDDTFPPSFTVGEIMDTWTLQMGFPVVTVTRNYEDGFTTFSQKKFSLVQDSDSEEYKWHIPISITSESNPDFGLTKPRFWIYKNESQIVKNLTSEVDPENWLIVNVQTSGYYRVNYDPQNWNLLTKQLVDNSSVIHVINRGQLLDDSLTLARASLLTYELALNLTLYISNETSFLPWESYFNNVEYLFNMALDTDLFDKLKIYVNSLLASEYDRIGFNEPIEGETVLERAHRIHILKWACRLEHSDCVENATKFYAEWMTTPEQNSIPVNLRPVIYCTSIRNGNETEWEFAKSQYLVVDVASEKDRILTALACSTNETILNKYINDAVTPNSFVRKQDSRNVLSRVASGSLLGNRLTFEFLQKEWPKIREYFGAGLSLSKLINTGIAPKLKTKQDLEAIEKFREDYAGTFGFGERAVDEAIEITRTNLHWMKTNYRDVIDWLEKIYPTSYF